MQARLAILGLCLLVGCQGSAAAGSAATSATVTSSAPQAHETASAVAPLPSASASSAAPSKAGVIATLKADALRDMEAVRGTRMQVSGVFIKRTVARQGGFPSEHPLHTYNTVWLADSKDAAELLRCDLGEGWAVGVEPLDTIVVEGIAAFEDPGTIHNGPKELRIARCKARKAQ